MEPKLELPLLPSSFYAGEIELLLICRCLDNIHDLQKPFRIEKIAHLAGSLGVRQKDQISLLQNLLKMGVIYSLDPSASEEYIDPRLTYFLHAEKIIQALLHHHPEYVIGKRLFKFENEGQMLDGGFITNDGEDMFDALMFRLTSYYGVKNGEEPYLPGFIRLYECVGVADGRDFFIKRRTSPTGSITNRHKDSTREVFYIPKYVVLTKNEQFDTWVSDNQRICICIS